MDIIMYLIQLIQYQYQQICWLLNFICRYIPLKQWAFDDSHSPKYQKFKIDQLPIVKPFIKQTGNSFSNTINGSMQKNLNLFNAAMVNLFLKTPSVLSAEHLTITSTTTMVAMVSISVKSVVKPSALAKLPRLQCVSSAPTAITVWNQKNNANISSYINV